MRVKDKRCYYATAQAGMVITAVDPADGTTTRYEASHPNQVFAIPVGMAVSEPTSIATSVKINGVAQTTTSTIEYPNSSGTTDLYTVYSGLKAGDIIAFI